MIIMKNDEQCGLLTPRRLMKYWSGSRVEAEGRMARNEAGASPQRAVTTERRRQLAFCLAPLPVALILTLAFFTRWAEVRAGRAVAADIDAALRASANAKIHSNATHSSNSSVS
jgi:hypothetical protein